MGVFTQYRPAPNTSTMQPLPKTLVTHRGKIKATSQILVMQEVLFQGVIAEGSLSVKAQAAKAWECLEDRKRILNGRPLVKPVEAQIKKSKNKPSLVPLPIPASEPVMTFPVLETSTLPSLNQPMPLNDSKPDA